MFPAFNGMPLGSTFASIFFSFPWLKKDDLLHEVHVKPSGYEAYTVPPPLN
jgi:hypothetical protein